MNELSPRADQLARLKVPMRLSERQAVVLPHEREAQGQCMIADRNVDRGNEAALRDHLRQRYCRPELQLVCFQEYSVVADMEKLDLGSRDQLKNGRR